MVFETEESYTYYEVLQRASSFLSMKNQPTMIAEWLLRERLDWSKTALVQHYKERMPLSEQKQFYLDMQEFLKGRPVQQIIGHEWFFNRKFKVTPSTLIPRPETEEWLDRVLTNIPNKPLSILDIGTGTGVLSITMKLERPLTTVTATDISAEALTVAFENAQTLKADIELIKGDLFEPVKGKLFDVILSNPPYISEEERQVMDQSVIDFEPEIALFAENDGLDIYYQLAEQLQMHLKPGACAFFEIGYRQGEKVVEIFKNSMPTAKIELWQDFSQLDRVVAIYTQNGSEKKNGN